jgi:hypothetical protein
MDADDADVAASAVFEHAERLPAARFAMPWLNNSMRNER